MNFHDSKTPYPQLEIVSNKRDPHARILALEVHPPMIGAFPLYREPPVEALHLIKWLAKEKINVLDSNKVLNITTFLLKSSTHNEEAAAAYPKVSEEGLTTCGYPQSGFNKFRYTTCYWEWVEDFLNCNKKVLDHVKEVFVCDCVSFWFKGLERYKEPPTWVSKQRAKPRSSHSPSVHIDMSFLPRVEEENAPFIELGVEEFLREEINLAIFLTCWFCKFVFPAEKLDNIRPQCLQGFKLNGSWREIFISDPSLGKYLQGF
ncbi:hypothetical protein HAX54_040191 [Datura stramonium]|uniref:Uncharacterized protein n=1 Tax=Datura stramonium TaxID=4076 RepID=A0ABS8VNN1_DATST|nr:hypothetical protein [Datura stramonium]